MAECGEEEELDDDVCLDYAETLEIELHPNYLEKTRKDATQPDVPMISLDSDKEDGKPTQECKGTHKDSPNGCSNLQVPRVGQKIMFTNLQDTAPLTDLLPALSKSLEGVDYIQVFSALKTIRFCDVVSISERFSFRLRKKIEQQ